MVLEALAAVSLASAVVQFVDFTTKLLSKGNQYYKSANGSLEENAELGATAKNLNRISQSLIDSTIGFSTPGSLSSEEEALCAVAHRCQEIARQLGLLIIKLEGHGSFTRWKSFRQAAKVYWSKDEIEQMLQRLSVVRGDLVVHLLVVINYRQKGDTEILLQSNEEIEAKMIRTVSDFAQSIKQELDGLSSKLYTVTRQENPFLLEKWKTEHQDVLHGLSDEFSALATERKHKDLGNLVLHSLEFPQLQERHAKISEAHSKTFNWIFVGHESDSSSSFASFTDWLEGHHDEDGIYWVTGKAGSGKSTLMRYLYEEQRTKECLGEWAKSEDLLLASCFFWNAGTSLQKSLTGLLRALLFQVLSQYPELIPKVASKRWQSYELGLSNLQPWTDRELLEAFRYTVTSSKGLFRICLFVDGLDEFDGDESAISNFLDLLVEISTHSHVKMCLSSRPWLIFQDAFKDRPSLLLQDLTRGDIALYVETELEASDRFAKLKKRNREESLKLARNVVDKASGVFLWVYLVVRSLLEGLRNGDDLRELQQRLDRIPARLKEYLAQIVNSLEPLYLEQAMQLFDIALQAHEPLGLLTYSFIHESVPSAPLKFMIQTLSQGEIEEMCATTIRRLSSRCKGLLEVSGRLVSSVEDEHPTQTVDFLHRTVRDFLETRSMQEMIHRSKGANFDANRALCGAFLSQIKVVNMIEDHSPWSYGFASMLEGFLEYARRYERATEKTAFAMIEELDEVAGVIFRKARPEPADIAHWTCLPFRPFRQEDAIFEFFDLRAPILERYDNGTLLPLALGAGLSRYVLQKIKESGTVGARPEIHILLILALSIGNHSMVNVDLYFKLNGPDMELIEWLLAHGADPHYLHGRIPRDFILFLIGRNEKPNWSDDYRDLNLWLPAIYTLIKYDAFVNIDCTLPMGSGKKALGGKSWHSRNFGSPLDVFREIFGDDECHKIELALKHSQSRKRRLAKRISTVLNRKQMPR